VTDGLGPEEQFRRLVEVAQALATTRQWEKTGRTWIEAARVAIDHGALGAAKQALEAAGEAFRRDDRPEDASRALRMALDLPHAPAEGAIARVRLGGMLGELARADEARALLEEALAIAEGPLRAVVLDTRVGLELGFGRKRDVRPRVDELEAAEGPAGIARWFRRGQLRRLDGDLDGAEACFREVSTRLRGREGADAGLAAARTEVAEVEVLRGRTAPAVEAYERGRALHETAGRRSLAYRCEAGRVRAMVEGGVAPLPSLLAEGIDFAIARGLVMLEADLRIARGMAVAAADPQAAAADLRRAAEASERAGARLSAGRAWLQLGTRIPLEPERRREALERAVERLEDHAPLHARARDALHSSSST
jgi:tetratricopeptide (TPR) repeat protein